METKMTQTLATIARRALPIRGMKPPVHIAVECDELPRLEASRSDWEPTALDPEYVTDELGYKPTEEQWADAGLKWVGGSHVGDGPPLEPA